MTELPWQPCHFDKNGAICCKTMKPTYNNTVVIFQTHNARNAIPLVKAGIRGVIYFD